MSFRRDGTEIRKSIQHNPEIWFQSYSAEAYCTSPTAMASGMSTNLGGSRKHSACSLQSSFCENSGQGFSGRCAAELSV